MASGDPDRKGGLLAAFSGMAMLDQLPDPCWWGDPLGRCLFLNRAWRAFADDPAGPDLQGAWVEAIHPEDRDWTLQTLSGACQAGAPFTMEYRIRQRSGKYRWVSDHGTPWRDPEGAILGYLGLLREVHDRRALEERAIRMGQLYQALGQVNRAVAQNLAPEAIFEEACRVSVAAGQFRLAWVGLLDGPGREIRPIAVAGGSTRLSDEEILAILGQSGGGAGPEHPALTGMAGRACLEGHFILCNDLLEDEGMLPWRGLAHEHGVRAVAVFPFVVRGQARGVLALYAEEAGAFDSEVVDLLDRVADDISLSIERFDQAQRRTEIEGRLRASERLFADTLDTLTAAIAILDEQGRILAANSAWGDFQDPGNPLVAGLGIGSDYGGACSGLLSREGGLGETAMGILEVIGGVRAVLTAEYAGTGEAPGRWYASTVSRFSNEGQQRVVVAHREITDKKAGEERLRQSEYLYRLITENAMDLIALAEADGRRLYASPSYTAILGYTREELEAQGPMELIHPDDRPATAGMLRALVAGQREFAATEYRMLRKGGKWGIFESRMAAIQTASGGPVRILVVARDITARKAAEEDRRRMEIQLRHAQKLESIGQLAAGIAHEINTPTQYIGDNLRFLQDHFQGLLDLIDGLEADSALQARLEAVDYAYLREEIPAAVQQSLEGVARVAKIVGAMKEFSHPGSEEMTLSDLNRGIESSITVSRNEWKYVAELALDLDPALPSVPCHPGEINQVILNLVVNAAHAIGDVVGNSGQKGQITVRTRLEGAEAVIQVEDTGGGIPAAIQDRVFDPFFTTKGVGKGSGQGLAIAHSVVVDKHGGSIGFESEPGKGTTFTVRLPLALRSAE